MAGLLDTKTRILDTIFTTEGKRQASTGKMRAQFYSFTDGGTFYALSDTYASGSQDFIARIGLEVGNLPQDRIVFESDDSGKLVVREIKPVNSNLLTVANGQIFSGSGGTTRVQVTGSEFQGIADQLLGTSIDNYQNLYLLAPKEPFEGTYSDFIVSPRQIPFTITNNAPIPPQSANGAPVGNVDQIESLFADKRLSHIPNYQFLPPINKPRLGVNADPTVGVNGSTDFGLFYKLGQQPILTYSDLKQELDILENTGFSQTIYFTETSRENHLIGQFFEIANGQVTKLDVIDFGLFTLTNNELKDISEEDFRRAQDRGQSVATKHVFFVGKLYVDSQGSHTFINVFTLIFE